MLLDFQSSIAIILNLSHDSLCASKQSLCDFYMGTTMDLRCVEGKFFAVMGHREDIFEGAKGVARGRDMGNTRREWWVGGGRRLGRRSSHHMQAGREAGQAQGHSVREVKDGVEKEAGKDRDGQRSAGSRWATADFNLCGGTEQFVVWEDILGELQGVTRMTA